MDYFFWLGDANVNKYGKKRSAMLWEMIPSLITAFRLFTLSPSPSCTCHAGYLQVDGSILSEEFFKAAYYGNLKAEQQVIRLKKEFIA